MKIRKIKLENNPFFGNIEFDFVDVNGKVMDNIVLAGENGCGKTQLLNLIYDFTTMSTSGEVRDEVRTFFVVFTQAEMQYIVQHMGDNRGVVSPTGEMKIIKDFSVKPNTWGRIKVEYQSKNADGTISDKPHNAASLFHDEKNKKLFSSIFSTIEVNYNPKATTSITAKEIDEEFKTSIRSSGELATDIQQLLIDISSTDAIDLQTWVEKNPGMAPPEVIKNTRMKRFKNAFSRVFTDLNYDRISTIGGERRVVFKKNNKDIEIATLSSGEKQIVFRGAFLLKNQQTEKGCVVLIDEPELSMHPTWQKKIFDYYRNLFREDDGTQTSQVFMATHSQYVLQSALENMNDTLIVILKNDAGVISKKNVAQPMILPTVTIAELIYEIFDVVSNDYHIELYGYLQNKIATNSVSVCDKHIKRQVPFYDAAKHRKPSRYGNTRYQTLPTYIRNAIDHPDPSRRFTEQELRCSIELLRELCR